MNKTLSRRIFSNKFRSRTYLSLLISIMSTSFVRNEAWVPHRIMNSPNKYQFATFSSAIHRTEREWEDILTPNQFSVLRLKATEPPGFSERSPGELEYELKRAYGTKYPSAGAYECMACGSALFSAKSKFDSGCGWPAFYESMPGAVGEIPDADGRRVEIVCNNCNSHLGHVFRGEGFSTPTDERHCVNGVCLRYNPHT